MGLLSCNDIEEAAELFASADPVIRTPLEKSNWLSNLIDAEVLLKREDLQANRSFKLRGAFNAISRLPEGSEIVCASAGNHAQGVAMACKFFQKKGTIFMPAEAPQPKVKATERFGENYVDIVLVGDNFDEALQASLQFQQEQGATFIHPFDQKEIIAGSAAMTKEVIDQASAVGKSIDYLIAPIGGGGLIAGCMEAVSHYSPKTTVIGAECSASKSMRESLRASQRIILDSVSVFADGVAVKQVGELPFQVAQENDLHVIYVKDITIGHYLREFFDRTGVQLEASGALSLAVLPREKQRFEGKVIACITSGANIDEARIFKSGELNAEFNSTEGTLTTDAPQDRLLEVIQSMNEAVEVTGEIVVHGENMTVDVKGVNKNKIPRLKRLLREMGFTANVTFKT